MNFRLSAATLASALTLLLCACPAPPPTPDAGDAGPSGGTDGGVPLDACSGGCAPNQVCDVKRLQDGGVPAGGLHRVCVDACGGCDSPKVCTKLGTAPAACTLQETKCNNITCASGQIACLAGACSCLSSSKAAEDSCAPEGKWCTGANCVAPKRYQQCKTGQAPCPTGHTCLPVFGADLFICTKQCGQPTGGTCERGELCSMDGCLPSGLFNDQECSQQIPVDGGAPRKLTVPVSNPCLLKDGNGAPTETTPTGNCTYQLFSFYDRGNYPIATCRPPGSAVLGGICKQDFSPAAIATQCGTGLECALTRGGDQGVCLKACNAAPTYPGFSPTPACGADEACTNIYRLEDTNAVLGVCTKKCNVFDPVKNTCANVGAAPASCVPTTADGKFAVSTDGTGVCIPQQVTTATEGMPCSEQDSFKGATCGNAQVCAALDVLSAPTCFAVCDTACASATPPARCATEPNAVCAGTRKCTRVTSTSGATLGFCK